MPARMTEAEALTELEELVAADKYPCLSAPALQRLLDAARRYTVWEASTEVEVGDTIVPTVWNGRMYRCIRPGTTGATEPQWPSAARAAALRPGLLGTLESDDIGIASDTAEPVIWEDVGPAPRDSWDLADAANKGWLKKAAAVAGDFDFKDAGQSLTRSQVHEHCLKMASSFTSAYTC